MIYTSKVIQEIVTSNSAKKALSYISPIYSEAEYFLRILNAIGSQLDIVWNFGQEMWNESFPHTARRLIEYWETEYGLAHDSSMSIDERQNVLLQKISASRSPMTPDRLEKMLGSIPGVVARVDENTGKNRFSVWLMSGANRIKEVKRIIERAKPAHLSYDLTFENAANGMSYVKFLASVGETITIRQVN